MKFKKRNIIKIILTLPAKSYTHPLCLRYDWICLWTGCIQLPRTLSDEAYYLIVLVLCLLKKGFNKTELTDPWNYLGKTWRNLIILFACISSELRSILKQFNLHFVFILILVHYPRGPPCLSDPQCWPRTSKGWQRKTHFRVRLSFQLSMHHQPLVVTLLADASLCRILRVFMAPSALP